MRGPSQEELFRRQVEALEKLDANTAAILEILRKDQQRGTCRVTDEEA